METQAESNTTTTNTTNPNNTIPPSSSDEMTAIKDLRQQLETRINTRHTEQQELITSLTTLVPDLVSSLNLSLHVISSFNRRPFSPLPNPNPNPNPTSQITKKPLLHHLPKPHHIRSLPQQGGPPPRDVASALGVVRGLVAGCLLERVPFTAIDSSTVARKIENDDGLSEVEKAAVREVGGEDGVVHAVEVALRGIGRESGGGGVELEEEFVVSGKARVMVMGVDRGKLVRELPVAKRGAFSSGINSSGGRGVGRGVGGRGGMMGGMGTPPQQYQQQQQRGMGMQYGGERGGMMMMKQQQQQQQKGVGVEEEDVIKDLEELLNKKSFKEMQKSKTGEELLDLIHRPTAKETAVAAKVVIACF